MEYGRKKFWGSRIRGREDHRNPGFSLWTYFSWLPCLPLHIPFWLQKNGGCLFPGTGTYLSGCLRKHWFLSCCSYWDKKAKGAHTDLSLATIAASGNSGCYSLPTPMLRSRVPSKWWCQLFGCKWTCPGSITQVCSNHLWAFYCGFFIATVD